MSRPPDDPADRYTLADAVRASARIRRIRAGAPDPDLDAAFPAAVVDDLDVDAVIEYVETHRRVNPGVRAAELRDRSLLLEYQHQRDVERYERRLFSVLWTGHQLGVHPVTYGEPMGLRTRQAVYHRRTTLKRRRAGAVERGLGDEGRAREWLDMHAGEIHALADTLIDNRDDLLLLVDDGQARQEVARQIDAAGSLMNSRHPSQDLCTAVALAVYLLRPEAARSASDPVLRSRLAQGLRLLW